MRRNQKEQRVQTIPEWSRLPRRPTRYTLPERLFDRRQGRRDGRKGIPSFGELPENLDVTAENLHTPMLAFLHAHVVELVAEELRACLLDCDTRHEELEKARIDLVRSREERDAAQGELDRLAEPDPQKLAQRRTSEADHPEALVRKRRLREHERERAAARARLERCKQLCAEAERKIRECEVVIETRWKVAAEQAKSWAAHFDKRVAAYWKRLVRIHRSGPRINELLPPTAWQMPDWVLDPIKAVELVYEHRPVTVVNEGI